jgi:hypothetical protein
MPLLEGLTPAFNLKLPLPANNNWWKAFRYLHELVTRAEGKTIIFLDELPWMATRKSALMRAIGYYWNQYWSLMPNVILVVCCSSASWLIQKVIYNKGGLHNRTTIEMNLLSFNLSETKDYLHSRDLSLHNNHLVSLYMAVGGIPYYLRALEVGLSAQQNIQKLFFGKNALLRDEFSKLFDSFFENAQAYKELIIIIAQKK